MKTIYHILQEPLPSTEGKKYRTKWGQYGTVEWLENLANDNLLEKIKGTISRLYMSGHNDFPEFEVTTAKGKFSFERKGSDSAYAIGRNAHITCTRMKNISPMIGLEESLCALIIEIED